MATKQKAVQAVEAFGGEIDWANSYVTADQKYIIIDAPEGHIWDATEAATITISWFCGSASEFWDEVIDLVLSGTTRHYSAEA